MTAQQLKNSILQMAVQGKLVPQDPNDEPASVLLERIQAEKEQMIKDGKIKKEKNPSIIFRGDDNLPYEKVGDNEPVCIANEVPFEIPDSWVWARLEDLCEYIQRGKSPKYSPIKKYPVVAQKCNQWSGFSIKKAKFIDPDTLKLYGKERILQNKDLMWNSTGLGTLGRIAIYKETLNPYELAVADSHVTVIRPLKNFIVVEYLYFYFSSPSVQLIIEDLAEGSTKQKELATITIKNYLVPVPPRAEQQRIAEKIETLTPHIYNYDDQYESLEILNNGFPDQLKKSILQQAVQGKLVPQDPTDEPASVLLERIRAEKEQMIKDGKIKRDKHESAIYRKDDSYYEKVDGVERCIDDEIPFEIPESWEWVRFSQVLDVRDGTHDSPQYVDKGIPLVTSKNLVNGEIDFTTAKQISRQDAEKINSRSEVNNGDILFAMIGTIGNPVLIKKEREFCIKNMALFKPVSAEFLNMEFLFLFLQHEQFAMRKQASGGVQSFVSLTYLRNYFFPLPPYCEQEKIVNQVKLLIKTCDNLLLKNRMMEAIL